MTALQPYKAELNKEMVIGGLSNTLFNGVIAPGLQHIQRHLGGLPGGPANCPDAASRLAGGLALCLIQH